jgi:hypothetical protein
MFFEFLIKSNMKLQDVTIMYQGGSGGFALFYYLLLSGKFHTGLDYESVNELIEQQFNTLLIDRPAAWKKVEFWPDNVKCKRSDKKPKLFLICNPTWSGMLNDNLTISNDTYKILLYTDLKLQLRMAYEKRAYWFTDISRKQFNAPLNDKHYIKQIINNSSIYSNYTVDPCIREIIEKFNPNQIINLQEFVKTKVIQDFGTPNEEQIKFLNFWMSIQPAKSKFLLNKV